MSDFKRQLIRLGEENPSLRRHLRPILDEVTNRRAKFPEGKPADPTENMSEEDAEKWEEMNEEYGDVVKEKAKERRKRERKSYPYRDRW